MHGARGAVAERKQCCTHRGNGLVSLALARVHSPQRARTIRNERTEWAHKERTSAPCPDTCQTNLRGVVNSCREPPLYSTLSSLQSGASRTVPLFVVPMRVHRPAPGPLHGATDDDAERASSLREARHVSAHDARREETPLDRSPKPGRVRLARVASGAGKEDSTQSLGGGLGPSSGKDGGQTLRQRATGCG